jgi:hypothetical protein
VPIESSTIQMSNFLSKTWPSFCWRSASSDFSTFSTNTAYGWNGSFAGGKNHGETTAALLVVAFVSHAHAADGLPFGGEHLQPAYPPEIEPTYKPHVPQVGHIIELTIYRTPKPPPENEAQPVNGSVSS